MKLFWILLIAALVWGCTGDSTYYGDQGTDTDPVGVYLQCGDSIVINADWSFEHVDEGAGECYTTIVIDPDSSAVRIHSNLPGGVHQAWLMRNFDHGYRIYGPAIYPERPDFQMPFRGPSDQMAFDTSGTFYVRAIAGDSSVWMSRIIHYVVHTSIPSAWPFSAPPESAILDSLWLDYYGPTTLCGIICDPWGGPDSIEIHYSSNRGWSGSVVHSLRENGYFSTYWSVSTGARESGEVIQAWVRTRNEIGWSEFSNTLSVVAR